MKACPKCGEDNLNKYSKSGKFYKCGGCSYIGAYPRKKSKVKPKQEVHETSCADDYLDYLESRW